MLDWLRQQIEQQGASRVALIGLAIVTALAGIFLCTMTLAYAGSALMNAFSAPGASNVPGAVPTVADTTSSSDANPVFPFPTPVTFPPNPAVPVIIVGPSNTPAPAPTPVPTATPGPSPTYAPSPIPAPTATPVPPPTPVTYQVALAVPPNVKRGSEATATVTVTPPPSGNAEADFSAAFDVGGQQSATVPISNGSASWTFHVPYLARTGSVTVTVLVNGQNVGTQTVTLNIVGP